MSSKKCQSPHFGIKRLEEIAENDSHITPWIGQIKVVVKGVFVKKIKKTGFEGKPFGVGQEMENIAGN